MATQGNAWQRDAPQMHGHSWQMLSVTSVRNMSGMVMIVASILGTTSLTAVEKLSATAAADASCRAASSTCGKYLRGQNNTQTNTCVKE
jgi:hypothetical protein